MLTPDEAETVARIRLELEQLDREQQNIWKRDFEIQSTKAQLIRHVDRIEDEAKQVENACYDGE